MSHREGIAMSNKFDLNKLFINYLPPMNQFGPIEGRKYTLTHSDEMGALFLTIGRKYDYAAIDQKLRDEVLAEWKTQDGEYMLEGKVYISGGEYDQQLSKIRFMIFKKEMELALMGLIFGEKTLYVNYPWLLDCSIWIQFESIYSEYNQKIYYGTPRQYLVTAIQESNKKMSETQA